MSKRHKLYVIGLVLAALVISLSIGGVALARSEDPDTPEVLVNDVAKEGSITGNRAGEFAYYAVNYPGDQSVVTIRLNWGPADPVTRNAVGFVVYAEDGTELGRGTTETTRDSGVLEFQYSDFTEQRWLIQVFNYLNNRPIYYSIEATGVPEPIEPTPLPETEATDVEGTVEPPLPTGLIAEGIDGTLVGNRAGAYETYDIEYAGDGSLMTVTMNFWPDNPIVARGVGFNVYGPQGLVAEGESTGWPTERSAAFSTEVRGDYQIQIYNYVDGITIHYAIQAE